MQSSDGNETETDILELLKACRHILDAILESSIKLRRWHVLRKDGLDLEIEHDEVSNNAATVAVLPRRLGNA
jgi:hypothetical protein